MGRGCPRSRPRGIRAAIPRREMTTPGRSKLMTTRAKGVTVGPATVIVAASSKLPGTRGWRRKRKQGMFGRNAAAASHAAAKARGALRQLERATMMIGAVAAGLELLREVRLEGSNGTPSDGRTSPITSRSRSDRPSSRASRTGSSSRGKRSVSKSPPRATKKSRGPTKKTRGTATAATKRSRSRAAANKAGRVRATAKAQARSRATAKRTRSDGRSRSSATR
jgi:hypothetical protein